MEINRALVKQQAKELIRGNVIKLFFIALIIGFLAGSSSPVSSLSSSVGNAVGNRTSSSQSENGGSNSDDFFDNFDNFGDGQGSSDPFAGFDGNGKVSLAISPRPGPEMVIVFAVVGLLLTIIMLARLALAPLRVMLDGLFWQLIRGNNMSFGDGMTYIFKNTFDRNYWQKFLLEFVKSILLALLYILLIVPGVIFTYKWRFSTYILAEHPEMSFGDAMRASDKMTKGHKWELFVLDLSFIGWNILVVLTLGILNIYILPYYNTTMALYYENYKIRAYQEGAVTQYEFLSSQQKTVMYQQSYAQYGNTAGVQNTNMYYQPAVNQPVAGQPTVSAQPMTAGQNYYTPPMPQPVVQPIPEQMPLQPTPQPVQEQYQPAPQDAAPVQPQFVPEQPTVPEQPPVIPEQPQEVPEEPQIVPEQPQAVAPEIAPTESEEPIPPADTQTEE